MHVETVTLLQLTCLVFIALLFLGDFFLLITGTQRIQYGMAGDAVDLADRVSEGMLSDVHGQLRALGFTPLGVSWETVPGHGEFERHIYASTSQKCFATVFQFSAEEAPRTHLLSAFEDGGVVMTQNYHGGVEACNEIHWSGAPALSLPDDEETTEDEVRLSLMGMMDEHRNRLHAWIASGRAPLPCATTDDYLKAQEIYHQNPSLQRAFRPLILNGLLTRLAMLGIMPLLLMLWLGPWHKLPWIFLLGECILLHLYTRSGRTASTSE